MHSAVKNKKMKKTNCKSCSYQKGGAAAVTEDEFLSFVWREVVLLENIHWLFLCTGDITQLAKTSACQMLKGICCSAIYLRVKV